MSGTAFNPNKFCLLRIRYDLKESYEILEKIMTTSFELKLNFRYDPEKVLSMLQSETFQTSHVFGSKLELDSIERTDANTTFFHQTNDSLIMVQIWPNLLDETSTASGRISINKTAGITADAEASATLAPALAGTEITIIGTVKVNVMAGAGQLEKKFVSKIQSKFKTFESKMNEWLDNERTD